MATGAARAPRASIARVADARGARRERRSRRNLDAERRRRRGVARGSVADDALERARATALEATATIDLASAEGAGRRAMEAARAAAASADAAEAAASAATWDALERAARTAMAAFDSVVDGGGIDVMSTLVKALTDAFEGLPAIDRERFTTDGAAFFESLPNEASELANEAARRAGSIAVNGGGADFTTGAGLIAGLAALAMVASRPKKGNGMDEWAALASQEGDVEPAELRRYDPAATRKYFSTRPITLLKRGIRSFILLGGFSAKLWLDRKTRGENTSDAKRKEINTKRATQLRNLLVSLGPTYVKLGQVLSSRADLLPAEYIEELRVLQDRVPPFDDDLARRILDRELGPTADRLSLGSTPIASASLGQVYRGTWRNDEGQLEEVAVKVQRPGALVAISLDVGIIRSFAEPWRKWNNLNSDLEGLVDEWGRRFIAELDYEAEATNGENFAKAMASRSDLGGVVTAAPVFRQASTRRVLTTGWIETARRTIRRNSAPSRSHRTWRCSWISVTCTPIRIRATCCVRMTASCAFLTGVSSRQYPRIYQRLFCASSRTW